MVKLRYGSVCSGIEAATMAWHPLGWQPAFFSEIDSFPSAVLDHHYPSVPNLGDMTQFEEWPDAAIDLLVGGTPCQAFSVAGLRKGLADPRGNLSLTYLGIVDRHRPRWCLWENVPGVLSLDGGRAFGSILGGLAKLGYGFAYRVLDAQFVRVDGLGRAVPQRRRRVFVVGHLGDWRRAAAVLLEPESMCGNPPPRREARKDVAPTLSARTKGGGGLGTDFDCDGGLIANEVAPTLNASFGQKLGLENQHIDGGAGMFIASRDVAATLTRGAESSGKGGYAGRRQEDDDNLVAMPYTLAIRGRDGEPDLEYRQDGTANAVLTPNGGRAGIGVGAVAIQAGALRENPASGPDGVGVQTDVAYTLEARAEVQAVQERWAVRRLTPRECERLQGFPDDFTAIPYRNKIAADGPRYKALGNSMAVNVMRWIGRRIEMVEAMDHAILQSLEAAE